MDRFVVTGVRWQESVKRSKRKMVEACYMDSRKHYLHCIIDWTTDEVWKYIREHNLKYCSLYDEGFRRIGCILCPMNTNREREAERWPTYKKAYIKALDRALIRSRERGLTCNHESGRDFYDWWVSNRRLKQDPDQTVMFE